MNKTKEKHAGKKSKERIKKSDSIIVIAKTPIHEILKQVEIAKKAKDKLNKISQKEKPAVKKEPEARPKIKALKHPEEITSDLYRKEQQPDYSRLFGYLGSGKDAYSQYIKSLEYAKEEHAHEFSYELGEEKLERMIKKELTNTMLFGRDGVKEIGDIKEKERFDYWKQFNALWVMIKVDLLGFGYNG